MVLGHTLPSHFGPPAWCDRPGTATATAGAMCCDLVHVVGFPGAGKSTLLHELLTACESPESPLLARSLGWASWLATSDERIIFIGRWAGRHRTGPHDAEDVCQGADRIIPGPGTVAVRDHLRVWRDAGARLIISDTIVPELILEKSVIKAANDAGIVVKLLEVDTPREIAWQRALKRSGNLSGKVKAIKQCTESWAKSRLDWSDPKLASANRDPKGLVVKFSHQLLSAGEIRTALMSYLQPGQLQPPPPMLSPPILYEPQAHRRIGQESSEGVTKDAADQDRPRGGGSRDRAVRQRSMTDTVLTRQGARSSKCSVM